VIIVIREPKLLFSYKIKLGEHGSDPYFPRFATLSMARTLQIQVLRVPSFRISTGRNSLSKLNCLLTHAHRGPAMGKRMPFFPCRKHTYV